MLRVSSDLNPPRLWELALELQSSTAMVAEQLGDDPLQLPIADYWWLAVTRHRFATNWLTFGGSI